MGWYDQYPTWADGSLPSLLGENMLVRCFFVACYMYSLSKGLTRQIAIVPKPELMASCEDSLAKPHFGVTSTEVAIICSNALLQ